MVLKYLQWGRLHNLPGRSVLLSVPHTIKQFFIFRWYYLCLSYFPLPPGTTKKSLETSSWYGQTVIRSPLTQLFSRLTRLNSQPFHTREILQSLHSPLLDLLQELPISCVLSSPKPDTELQIWEHQSWVDGQVYLTRPAGYALPNAPQDTIVLQQTNIKSLQLINLWKNQTAAHSFSDSCFP